METFSATENLCISFILENWYYNFQANTKYLLLSLGPFHTMLLKAFTTVWRRDGELYSSDM